MVTTRYSDQQGSKSRQKVMRLYKQWHRPISKRFVKPPYSISRATSIDSECCTHRTTQLRLTRVNSFSHNSAVSYATITQWCIFQGGELYEITQWCIFQAGELYKITQWCIFQGGGLYKITQWCIFQGVSYTR